MANKNVVELIITAKDQATSVFTSLTAKLSAVATAVAGYFGVSLFTSAVKGAADLEAGMSRIQAASGASAQEMEALKKAAVDAGAATKYTSTEAASALETLIKAGLGAQDAIGALPAVLNLAQAGDVSLAAASDYVTKAVKGMGLAFTDSARVADVLAMGANASSTSVTGLAEALSYAAPVAKAAGLSLEQTVAIIGKFADAGIDASRAGTALNSILAQFLDPTSKFKEELGAAGIVTTDFDKALRELAAAGPKGQKAIQAVGLEAGPALRAVMGQGIGALDELKGKLDNAAGSAAKAAAIMEGNLNGAFNSLGSAWDTVKNALGEPVLPVLTDGVKQLATALSGAVSNGTIGRFGEAFAAAFQSAITWAKSFAAEIDFTAAAAKLQAFAERTGEVFTQIGVYANNAGNAVQLVYGVMSAGTNGVLAVVYGLGSAFAGVASNIQSGLALLYDGLSKVTFGGISAAYKQAAEEIRASAGATWAASEALGQKAAESFTGMTEGALLTRKAYDGLTSATSKVATAHDASAAAIQGVVDKLQEVGNKAPTAAQKQIQAAEEARASIVKLREEYSRAMDTGSLQLAAEKLKQIAAEQRKVAESAEDSKARIDQAYKDLGLTSTTELNKMAAKAKEAWQRIEASETESLARKKAAFLAYAQAEIAANDGVASELIKSKAAALGMEVAVDSAGKAVIRTMNDGKTAIEGVGQAYVATAEQIKAQTDAMDTLMMRYKLSADYSENQIALLERQNALTERQIELENKRLGMDKNGFALDKAGNTAVSSNASATSIAKQLTDAGVASEDAKKYASQLTGGQFQPKGGNFSTGQFGGGSLDDAIVKILEMEYEKSKNTTSKTATTSTSTAKPASTDTTNVQTVNHVITIPVNGQKKSFSVASDADVATVQAVLASLLSAKSATGL